MVVCTLWGCSTRSHNGLAEVPTPHLLWSHAEKLNWQSVKLPGKADTRYALDKKSGQYSLKAEAQSSASMLRKEIRLEPEFFSDVSFSWWVPNLISTADMEHRDQDDSPVRIILAFEGDRSKFSIKNSLLNELTHAITGEPMPYATLMYVWCNHRPPETVIKNPRTDRIRKIVVESGTDRLNQWLVYGRNIRLDFEKAFGEPPGALIGIGLMTDSDNTKTTAQAWYGAIEIK